MPSLNVPYILSASSSFGSAVSTNVNSCSFMIEFLVRRLASADNDRQLGECRAHGLRDSAALTSHESCIHHDQRAGNTTCPKYSLVVRPSLRSNCCFPRIGWLLECACFGDRPLPCLRFLSRDAIHYTIASRADEVNWPAVRLFPRTFGRLLLNTVRDRTNGCTKVAIGARIEDRGSLIATGEPGRSRTKAEGSTAKAVPHGGLPGR